MQVHSLAIVADVGAASFHVGDEAMLAANIAIFRQHIPGLRFKIIGREEIDSVREEPNDNSRPSPIEVPMPPELGQMADQAAQAMEDADGLFISGGGNLSSTWPKLLYQRIALIEEAAKRRLPIVTGGQTIGPELNEKERSAIALALSNIDLLGMREIPSTALGLHLGLSPYQLHYQPDDAFFLSGRPPEDDAMIPIEEPFLAVSLDPSFDEGQQPYELVSLAAQLSRIAHEFRLAVTFVPNLGPLGHVGSEDGRVGTQLNRLLREERVSSTVLPVMPPAATVWLFQRATAVVSSRYHPLVFSTAGAVPSLGIYRNSYTRIKLQGALAHVGLANYCMSARSAATGLLYARFRELWAQSDEVRAKMRDARTFLQRAEDHRWQLVLSRLGLTAERPDKFSMDPFGWPQDRLSHAALSAFALESEGNAESLFQATEYAGSLKRELGLVQKSREEAERYAKSLEAELRRLASGQSKTHRRP